jgi:hypothetical protein
MHRALDSLLGSFLARLERAEIAALARRCALFLRE